MKQESTKMMNMANCLKEAILSGKYAYGERLPSCREMQKEHGVSYVTACKAMQALERDGYITLQKHIGAQVSYTPKTDAPAARKVNIVYNHIYSAMPDFARRARAVFERSGWEVACFDTAKKGYTDKILMAVNSPDAYTVIYFAENGLQRFLASREHFLERTVCIGKYYMDFGLTCISCDESFAMRRIVRHLFAAGKRRVAIFQYQEDNMIEVLRIATWRSMMLDAGLGLDWCNAHVFHVTPDEDMANTGWCHENFRELYERGLLSDCDALVFPWSHHARIFQELFLKHGVRVPEAMGIVAIGDDEILRTATPPITCLDNDLMRHVEIARDILESRQRGEPYTRQLFTFEPKLIIRESTFAKRRP